MKQTTDFLELVKQRSAEGNVFFRPILMQFAAHYIGKTYRDFYLDHKVLVEANIACMKYFGMDAVGLISDPMREAEALGAICVYPDEAGPYCQDVPVKTLMDVENLFIPDWAASRRTQDRIHGVELFRKNLGNGVPVIGWIEGPLAEACDLVGVSEMLQKLALEPEFSSVLLKKLTLVAKSFAKAQIDAGCDIIGMGDAICSQISPRMYRKFIKELHGEIIAYIQEQGALAKVHICGNITHLLPHLAELQPDIVDIDWMVDMEHAYQVLGADIIRAGNLDPVSVVEQSNVIEIGQKTEALVKAERGRAFILSGGCEITPNTPAENLLAMYKASRLK